MKPCAVARLLGAAALLVLTAAAAGAQGRPTTLAATRGSTTDLRAADQLVDAMIRDHALVVRDVQHDALVPDRVHERLDQYVRGVRIVGSNGLLDAIMRSPVVLRPDEVAGLAHLADERLHPAVS